MAQSKGNSNWRGGICRRKNWYVYIYMPKHPFALDNYVAEHRLVMEKKLGRYLKFNELVHHINGIKNDNRIENLELSDSSKHATHHFKLYFTPEIRKALSIKKKGKPFYSWKGKHHKEESKNKTRLALKGIPKTEEHKKALKEGWKRRRLLKSL